jgi:hypothetical protein
MARSEAPTFSAGHQWRLLYSRLVTKGVLEGGRCPSESVLCVSLRKLKATELVAETRKFCRSRELVDGIITYGFGAC